MTPLPPISIVIPALQEEHYLPLLLRDIAAQTLRPVEVIVVDGGSSDRTVELAHQHGARVIQTHRGVGHQRSHGGQHARGDILVFLDSDVRLAPNFLAQAVPLFIRRRYAVACPWYWPHGSTIAVRACFACFGGLFWLLQKISPSGAGCCIIVTRSLFERCGGFRSAHTYDDICFVRRAARRGRFGILPVRIHVSDRRFRHEGTVRVILKYLFLSPFFFVGAFRLANIVRYRFAHYHHRS